MLVRGFRRVRLGPLLSKVVMVLLRKVMQHNIIIMRCVALAEDEGCCLDKNLAASNLEKTVGWSVRRSSQDFLRHRRHLFFRDNIL